MSSRTATLPRPTQLLRRAILALAPLLLLSITAAPALAAGAQRDAVVPHRDKAAFPQVNLGERESRGQRALQLLGNRLPEVAAFYGQSPDEFRARMLADRTRRLDQRGRVFIVEELDRPLPATPAPAATTGLIDGTYAPLDQTFLLHSKPGAQRTIHLNFRGATLTGSAWNGSGGSINALPFDTDGIPYSFSSAELQRIQAIWQRVAEDYAPFDVNVTTEAVPLDRITRAGSTDSVFGTTVLITSNVGVYNCSCGGVAYLGVFDDTSDFYKPALVFYNQLGSGSEKYVAEAISHEAGHNMGLGHDGGSGSGYYGGHGSGATGWAPIMGVGYYQSLVQWSKGEYSGATNTQDDFAVMQSNGLPLRADDHGDTAATATALTGITAGGLRTLAAQGIIERATDTDMFSFAAGAGSASFNISPAARSANLDLLVTLRNAAGTVLASANPVDALAASFSFTLPAAGTYTLAVQGTGKPDPLATGYSSYGSLGQYALSATVPAPGAQQPPVALISTSTVRGTAPLTVAYSGAGSTDSDGNVQAWAWTFSDGGSASGVSTSRTYNNPGSYNTVLQVTDNSGLTASSSVTVTVDPPVTPQTMRVADIAMGLAFLRSTAVQGTAVVKVLDGSGVPVAGANVSGQWSGLVARSSSITTDASGLARFSSPFSRATSGSFNFAVTNVSRSAWTYAPLTNTETSDSINR